MAGQHRREFLLLLDDLELRREGFKSLMAVWSDALSLDTLAMAPEGLSELAGTNQMRLVILNLGGSPFGDQRVRDLLARVREMFAGVPSAILSDRRDPEDAISAAGLGVQAFFTTAMQPEIAKQAVAFVIGGGTYFPREALLASGHHSMQPANGHSHRADLTHDGLTPRQYEVLDRLRYGKSNKHIARELNMQEATVKVHVRQIMRKLGAANRTQAALLAQQSHARPTDAGASETYNLPTAAMIKHLADADRHSMLG